MVLLITNLLVVIVHFCVQTEKNVQFFFSNVLKKFPLRVSYKPRFPNSELLSHVSDTVSHEDIVNKRKLH